MRIAFLNLCHTDPPLVARAAARLTAHPDFDMYIHVDKKSDIHPFVELLGGHPQVYFVPNRKKVYWGGFNAIEATMELLREALESPRGYDYFVVLQNLDYPIRSNRAIAAFFAEQSGTEFIRGCRIAHTRDWHYARKYKIYNQRDDDFYLAPHSKPRKYLRYAHMLLKSARTLPFNGDIAENGTTWAMHYGAAQWAVTRDCAQYFLEFYATHPKFNEVMRHVQFPDEEYFHTIVHNSPFKYRCVRYDEPEQRWLVNWRNLHYFEYPREITLLVEADYDKIMDQDALFIRKVRSGMSDRLLDRIDATLDADDCFPADRHSRSQIQSEGTIL